MSQVPYAELQASSTASTRRSQDPWVQADRPCASTRLRCAINRDKLGDIGDQRRHRRPHAGDDARRPPGDALQARRRAVRRDRAGGAGRPHHTRRHQRHLRAQAATASMVAARQPGRRSRRRRAAVAQSLQPAARGQDHRHARAGLHDRRGAAGDGRHRATVLPPTAQTSLDGQSREFRASGRDLLHVRARRCSSSTRALRRSSRASRIRSSSCCRCRCR